MRSSKSFSVDDDKWRDLLELIKTNGNDFDSITNIINHVVDYYMMKEGRV